MNMRRISLPLLAALLSGCAGSTLQDPDSDVAAIRQMLALAGSRESDPSVLNHEVLQKDTVPLPPERAWDELVRTYATLRIPVARIDAATRRIGGSTRPLGLIGGQKPSAWLDCGHGMADVYANQYEVTFSMATRVMPLDPGRSTIESIVRASARPRDVSTQAFRCTSLHTLEQKIGEMIRQGAGT